MAPFTRLLCLGRISILLFKSLGVLWVLSYPASHPNHTSYRKFYFYEFFANVLRDNMGRIIFDLRGCGGCQRPKTSHLDAHFNSTFSSSYSPSSTKDSIRNDFQPLFSLHISSSRSPQGLISSTFENSLLWSFILKNIL